MNRIRPTLLVLTLLMVPAASTEAKSRGLEAPDSARGVIGVSIRIVPPAKIGSSAAEVVYFVRVGKEEDLLGAEFVLKSNHHKGDRAYLLNAKPGRYVAVACYYQPGGALGAGDYNTYFSANLIKLSETEVRAGEVVFMGEMRVQSSTKMNEADSAQQHYWQLVSPENARKGGFARTMTGDYDYTGTADSIQRDAETERRFWTDAVGKDFKKEDAWLELVEKKLGQVPKPPTTP